MLRVDETMNDDSCKLFERVAKKMGWKENGGLEEPEAERKLRTAVEKKRHAALNSYQSDLPVQLCVTEREDDSQKENLTFKDNHYRNKSFIESSDDDFDQFLVERATPKAKPASQKQSASVTKNSSNYLVVSSDDDDGSFETFLQRVKTPNAKPKKMSECGSEDSLKNFIVEDSSDDEFMKTSSFKVPKNTNTPAAARHPWRRPLSQCDSPVFVSDSDDDDDNIVVKSTWRTRHLKPQSSSMAHKNNDLLDDKHKSSSLLPHPISSPFPPHKTLLPASPKRALSAPSKWHDSASSEEEFTSLLERLKKKNLTSTSFTPKNNKDCTVSVHPIKGNAPPTSKALGETPLPVKTPGRSIIVKPTISQTEPRHGPTSRVALCKTPGCFLQSLSNPDCNYGRNFKQNKEGLTSKLYHLYNTSVLTLPVNMSVTWNKKMRKTAGYCITGQERGGGSRYARIELSEKVCDSADRLRDTLIHEMCHAATWLINGVRDGHGNFWKLYARKATVMHPELPMVTRCHSYDIKYKFQYQCTRCQNTIGRHSKSLDTQRFVCALCTGQLVLLTPSKPRAPTPFANFVKENYGTVRQELAGQSHADVMRKLSADFASKTKLSQS
ncbi:hypothetical protein Q5P01_009140 [Channa striata]|uniref:SprT-like domain-containing protein n=1 Tax=Channa striata TaxID=64152 RepID=A0AA88N0M8_CHASR|nr:hypothetical protein Q5P01_009140 [Channa striata]